MDEAFLVKFGDQLRCFFSIVLQRKPSNPQIFWETHKVNLAEDWGKEHGQEKTINMILKRLQSI